MPVRRQMLACVWTTKHMLHVLAYTCECMLDTGRYNVYAAVVLLLFVPSVDR